MKPEQFQDPAYVPKNGAEWEAWIWFELQANPGQSSSKLKDSHPYLSLGAASGYLSKLVKRGQVAAVKWKEPDGGREALHYSVAVKDYTPAERKRNVRTKQPIPPFNFDHVDKPIAIIEAVTKDAPKEFKPSRVVENLSLQQSRQLYDYLHSIFGPRK